MSAVSFDEWLAAWLDEVDEGLSVHAGVVLAYGARNVSHLDTFDASDIKALADNFRAAGVAPLQCKWILKRLTERVAAAKAAAKAARKSTSGNTRKQPGSRPTEAPHSRHQARRPAADGEGGENEEEDEEEGGEEDDEYELSEVEEEAPEAGGKRRRAPNVTTRPRKRQGQKRGAASSAAAASGRGTIPEMFEKSEAPSNRHGLGGQASAGAAERGSARPFAGLGARDKGCVCVIVCERAPEQYDVCQCCADAVEQCKGPAQCARALSQIVDGAAVALRTPSEIVKIGATTRCVATRLNCLPRASTACLPRASTVCLPRTSHRWSHRPFRYNLARLKQYLVGTAFDPSGSPKAHLLCLMPKLGVDRGLLTS